MLGDLEAAQRELASAHEDLAAAEARLTSTKSEIRRLARAMLEQEEALIGIAEEMYKTGSSTVLDSLLSAKSFTQLEQRLSYLSASERRHTEEIEGYAATAGLLEQKLTELGSVREEAVVVVERIDVLEAHLRKEVAAGRDELAAAQDKLERARAQARADALAQALADAAEAEERARAASAPPQPSRGPHSVNWDAIAQCESGGNWKARGTYHGGLQFHPQTWLAYGGGEFARYAYEASRAEQITVAERVLKGQGPGAWPHCFQYG